MSLIQTTDQEMSPLLVNYTLSQPSSAPLSILMQTFTTTITSTYTSAIPSLYLPTATPKSKLGPHPHGSAALRDRVHVAHGTLAAIVMVLLFPSVAIFLRVRHRRGANSVRWHYTLQLINIAILLLAFSLGVWLSWLDGWLWHWPHQILGTVIVAGFLLQPLLGLLQHRYFRATGVRSRWRAGAHVWCGRLLITLGIINGGLGLRLADNASWGRKSAYIVLALVMLVVYVGVMVWYRIVVMGRSANSAAQTTSVKSARAAASDDTGRGAGKDSDDGRAEEERSEDEVVKTRKGYAISAPQGAFLGDGEMI